MSATAARALPNESRPGRSSSAVRLRPAATRATSAAASASASARGAKAIATVDWKTANEFDGRETGAARTLQLRGLQSALAASDQHAIGADFQHGPRRSLSCNAARAQDFYRVAAQGRSGAGCRAQSPHRAFECDAGLRPVEIRLFL